MVTIYRTMIVASTVLFAVMYWLPYFDVPLYSEDVNQLRRWDGMGAVLTTTWGLEIGIFLTGVAIPILMYLFVPWSRQAFLIFTLIFLFANAGFGVRVLTPLDIVLGNLITLSDGAILAIAYFTSVGQRFRRTSV